jgi:Bacterial archaeo-eukaryotic release factor family 11
VLSPGFSEAAIEELIMATRYELPTLEDLNRLGESRERAITIYAQTSPIVSERQASFLNAKSGFDTAIHNLRQDGLARATENALRAQWDSIADGIEPWSRLSSSLAIFIAPDDSDVYVLPNRLENQQQAADYFDLGQLVRAVTTPQEAYALTLSANGWGLWVATAKTRATELALEGEYPTDVADATNRATIRGRDYDNRLVGDEGRKTLLETYAKRVSEAVHAELGRLDPHGERPLFLFATDPLLDLYRSMDHRRQIVSVPGGPDGLRPDQIDEPIRRALSSLNAERVNQRLEKIGNDVSAGLVLTDLVDIARASAAGAIATLVYDFTLDIFGTIEDASGEITYATDELHGYDLLSRIAVATLQSGGQALAVRSEEITAQIWNGAALAHLRFALA